MKLSEQVCALEQAKRLKELGVIQESLFYHTHFTGNGDGYFFSSKHNEIYFKDNCKEYKDIGDYDFENSPMTPTGEDRAGRYKIASAFTVAELGVMLPHPSSLNEMGGWLHNSECDTTSTDGLPWYLLWEYDLDKENAGFGRHIVSGVTEAEARAAMCIYLLEHGIITAEEINKRLTGA